MPGEGIFDLSRYLELLRQIGYNGFLSLELFREDLWASDPLEVVRMGLEKMRAVVEQEVVCRRQLATGKLVTGRWATKGPMAG